MLNRSIFAGYELVLVSYRCPFFLSSSCWIRYGPWNVWSVNKVVKVWLCQSWSIVSYRSPCHKHKQIAHDLKLQNLAYLLFSTSKNIYLEIFTLVQPNQGPVFGRKVSRSLTEHSASRFWATRHGPQPAARASRTNQTTDGRKRKRNKKKRINIKI